MAKIPTMDEMAKQLAENALDNFLYDGKSLREWMKIIASEDAISRQATLNAIIKELCIKDESYLLQSEKAIYNVVKNMPPVTPQPKTGHWIYDDECKEHGHCSECGHGGVDLVDGASHNYCPNCGAKMEVEE